MKGFFVGTTYRPLQGLTDVGYYTDGGRNSPSGEDLMALVERDEAYKVEIFPVLGSSTSVRLSSANREIVSSFECEVGVRKRGLRTTVYQATDDSMLPGDCGEREQSDQVLSEIVEYALEHGKKEGLTVEGFSWENILDYGQDTEI